MDHILTGFAGDIADDWYKCKHKIRVRELPCGIEEQPPSLRRRPKTIMSSQGPSLVIPLQSGARTHSRQVGSCRIGSHLPGYI